MTESPDGFPTVHPYAAQDEASRALRRRLAAKREVNRPSSDWPLHNPPCIHSFIKWDCLSCLEGALWRCNKAYQEQVAAVENTGTVAPSESPDLPPQWQRRAARALHVSRNHGNASCAECDRDAAALAPLHTAAVAEAEERGQRAGIEQAFAAVVKVRTHVYGIGSDAYTAATDCLAAVRSLLPADRQEAER